VVEILGRELPFPDGDRPEGREGIPVDPIGPALLDQTLLAFEKSDRIGRAPAATAPISPRSWSTLSLAEQIASSPTASSSISNPRVDFQASSIVVGSTGRSLTVESSAPPCTSRARSTSPRSKRARSGVS
jgi:hypothetical protein